MSALTEQKTDALAKSLIAIRRHLHQYPELSHQEINTTKAIKNWLGERGIRIVNYGLKTGAVAEIGNHTEGPVILLRADIDALPIEEETGLPYASRIKGRMHACGHDFHTAAMIGAAYLLKERETDLRGTVRFLFQPAEEVGGGAGTLIKAGVLEGADAIFGMHNKPDLPTGTIGLKDGPLMAGVDHFKIYINGVGTHAAAPHHGVDPVIVAAHIVTALQTIVSRNLDPFEQAVVSVAHIKSGSTWNVISNEAFLEGTVRTFDDQTREKIPGLIRRIIDGTAAAHDATARLEWIPGPPAVNNDAGLNALARNVAGKLGFRITEPQPSMGGEDFAEYQRLIPGSFAFMGTSGTHEWHHPQFTLDEEALPLSAAYFAELAEAALDQLNKGDDENE